MLKKRFFGMMTLLVGIMLVFAIAGCSETPTNTTPQKVTFTGTDDGNVVYSLEITQNTARAAYTPRAGDSYKLTTGSKTSTGTVVSYYIEGALVLQPGNENAEQFSAVVSGTGLISLNGIITFDDETIATAPGALTPPAPPAGGGTVTDYIGTWENSFTDNFSGPSTRRMKIDGDGTFYHIYFPNDYPNAINLINYGKWEFDSASKQLQLSMLNDPNLQSPIVLINLNYDAPMSGTVAYYKIENGKLKPASGSGTEEYTKK